MPGGGFVTAFAALIAAAVFYPLQLVCVIAVGVIVFGLVVFYIQQTDTPVQSVRQPRQAPADGIDSLHIGHVLHTGDAYCPGLSGGSHTVIGGESGSGKSNTINAIMCALAPLPDVQILGIDPKRGMELYPWLPRLCALTWTADGWLVMLRQLRAEVDRRADVLRDTGLQKVTPGNPEMPWLVLMIDETNEVLNLDREKDRRDEVEDLLMSLVSVGRAAGLSIVLATQKPSGQSIPTGIRDIFPQKIAFRTTTPQMTETITGQNSIKYQGADAHLIRRRRPGLASVLDDETGQFHRVQIREVTAAEVRATAAMFAHLTVPWNELVETPAPPARQSRREHPTGLQPPKLTLVRLGQPEHQETP